MVAIGETYGEVMRASAVVRSYTIAQDGLQIVKSSPQSPRIFTAGKKIN